MQSVRKTPRVKHIATWNQRLLEVRTFGRDEKSGYLKQPHAKLWATLGSKGARTGYFIKTRCVVCKKRFAKVKLSPNPNPIYQDHGFHTRPVTMLPTKYILHINVDTPPAICPKCQAIKNLSG